MRDDPRPLAVAVIARVEVDPRRLLRRTGHVQPRVVRLLHDRAAGRPAETGQDDGVGVIRRGRDAALVPEPVRRPGIVGRPGFPTVDRTIETVLTTGIHEYAGRDDPRMDAVV